MIMLMMLMVIMVVMNQPQHSAASSPTIETILRDWSSFDNTRFSAEDSNGFPIGIGSSEAQWAATILIFIHDYHRWLHPSTIPRSGQHSKQISLLATDSQMAELCNDDEWSSPMATNHHTDIHPAFCCQWGKFLSARAKVNPCNETQSKFAAE